MKGHKMDKRVLKQQKTTYYSEWDTLRLEEYNLWYTAGECARSNPILKCINGLPKVIKCLSKLFADDAKLYQIIKSNHDSDDLHVDVGKSK